ncbi:MAG: CRISPR-associated endonuclease Cas2 [Desulfohalobiaceae bacterium]|nr:CRISPR-associated endonuclease Cas2 [Desulfohalobiaceae bacterium]
MFYLVCFDIVNDNKRNKVAKILKGCGYRVQKSVFECPDLTEKKLLKLIDKIEKQIDAAEDSVRYYRLCRACLDGFEFSGLGEPPDVQDFKVI